MVRACSSSGALLAVSSCRFCSATVSVADSASACRSSACVATRISVSSSISTCCEAPSALFSVSSAWRTSASAVPSTSCIICVAASPQCSPLGSFSVFSSCCSDAAVGSATVAGCVSLAAGCCGCAVVDGCVGCSTCCAFLSGADRAPPTPSGTGGVATGGSTAAAAAGAPAAAAATGVGPVLMTAIPTSASPQQQEHCDCGHGLLPSITPTAGRQVIALVSAAAATVAPAAVDLSPRRPGLPVGTWRSGRPSAASPALVSSATVQNRLRVP